MKIGYTAEQAATILPSDTACPSVSYGTANTVLVPSSGRAPRKVSIPQTNRNTAIMPYANIKITKGAAREQKVQLVKDVTDSLVRVLGKKPEHTHIVIKRLTKKTGAFQAC